MYPGQKNLFYVSGNAQKDPAFNLALEEYALRHFPPENDYLLLYVNRPSVILGKHQNVAEEVNLPFCAEHKIPVLRRISGGGAVFHDAGCLNFSFITRHTLKNFNNYKSFLQPILEILADLNFPVETDAHNNLLFYGKKISGNAQFTSAGRLLSHGTLLFNADLSHLKKSLKINPALQIESRSTKSRRAAVTNLCEHSASEHCSLEHFRRLLLERLFVNEPREYVLSEAEQEAILQLADEKYQNWEWNFGRSPQSIVRRTIQMNDGQIRVMFRLRKGHIEQAQLEGNADFSEFAAALCKQRYDFQSLKSYLSVWPGGLPGTLDQTLRLLF